MARYWDRKRDMLKVFKAHGWLTAKQMTKLITINWINCMRMCLYYYRQGLLERKKDGREYRYRLTPKGEGRLRYYERFGTRLHPKREKGGS